MHIGNGLEYLRIYWVHGTVPKHWKGVNAVTDPPCSGWQHAIVMRGEKRSTIFCPYSLTTYVVRNNCSELEYAREPDEWPGERVVDLIHRQWKSFQSHGLQRDYNGTALFLGKLKAKVPVDIMADGEEDTRKRGGKDAEPWLTKPVKRKGKRGDFLAWFLDATNSARSVRETMAERSMTRSNVLSYLFTLWQDHGIGYELVGDVVTLQLPDGCTDPFDGGRPATPATEAGDDSWLD